MDSAKYNYIQRTKRNKLKIKSYLNNFTNMRIITQQIGDTCKKIDVYILKNEMENHELKIKKTNENFTRWTQKIFKW